jgi:hypothetical protein
MKEKHTRGDFLEALFGEYYEGEGNFIIVRSTRSLGATGNISYYPSAERLAAAKFPDDLHVLFGPCPREKMSPGKEHVRYVTALWAGLDAGPEGFSGPNNHFSDADQVAEAIESFPLQPSAVVRSGRGSHLYWFLQDIKKISDVSAFEGLLSRINEYFRCGCLVGVDSLLRLPGTVNPRYYGSTKRCYVEHMDPSLRYRGRDFRTLKLPEANRAAHGGKPGDAFRAEPPGQADSIHASSSAGLDLPAEGDEVPGNSTEATYEEILETISGAGSRPAEDALEGLAEKIAEKLGARLADGIAESVSDKIVERTVERLLDRLREVDLVK